MSELEYLADFRAVLQNPEQPYEPSAESIETLAQTDMVLFVGPSASGRNTIINELLQTSGYHYIVSDTTRAPRVNDGVSEQNGVQYWFRSEEEVLNDLRNGAFIEAAIIHQTQVSGVSVREIAEAHKKGEVAVTDIEIRGVETMKQLKPDVMCLFVVPPSFDAWQERLQARGTMDPKVYRNRMESAVKEFQAALDNSYYWIVINDDLQEAVEYSAALIQNHVPDEAKQKLGRTVVQEMLDRTSEILNNL